MARPADWVLQACPQSLRLASVSPLAPTGSPAHQPDAVLLLQEEEALLLAVEGSSIQEGLQRHQAHQLGAHHRKAQLLQGSSDIRVCGSWTSDALKGVLGTRPAHLEGLHPSWQGHPLCSPAEGPPQPAGDACLAHLGFSAGLLIDGMQCCDLKVQEICGHLGHVLLIQVPANALNLFQASWLQRKSLPQLGPCPGPPAACMETHVHPAPQSWLHGSLPAQTPWPAGPAVLPSRPTGGPPHAPELSSVPAGGRPAHHRETEAPAQAQASISPPPCPGSLPGPPPPHKLLGSVPAFPPSTQGLAFCSSLLGLAQPT